MGNFSWITQDTNESIPNKWSGRMLPVFMLDNKGNRYYEPCYGGYGIFGGKDFFVLVAEMNVGKDELARMTPDKIRSIGIKLAFSSDDRAVLFPNLVVDPDKHVYNPHKRPRDCPNQGDVFDEDEDE